MPGSSKPLVKTVAAVTAILVLGGWFGAKHYATALAQDRLDQFLIQKNLRGDVTYTGLSASPFGSAEIDGVQIKVGKAASISIKSLDISDVRMKAERLSRIRLHASGISVPALALARESGLSAALFAEAVSLGYGTLGGEAEFAFDYDDQKGTITLESNGAVRNAGEWNFRANLAGCRSRDHRFPCRSRRDRPQKGSGRPVRPRIAGAGRAAEASVGGSRGDDRQPRTVRAGRKPFRRRICRRRLRPPKIAWPASMKPD